MKKGYSIEFDLNSGFEHYTGGVSSLYTPICPNCKKNLILHMQIDGNDPRFLNWKFPARFILLFYCMRCPLSWYPFQYSIKEREIEVHSFHSAQDSSIEKEWEDEMGLEQGFFPRRCIDFIEIPISIQKLYQKMNLSEEISENDEFKIAEFSGNFAPDYIGGYPVVDVINQVGGITFLPQQVDNPLCKSCLSAGNEVEMEFLASMTNDKINNFKITFDSVQILFYLCPECKSIHVQHCM